MRPTRVIFYISLCLNGARCLPPSGAHYGERARLILAKLVATQSNVLILDEPINHLDIPSREQFEAALDTFPGTILVAVHDRAFIDRFATGYLGYGAWDAAGIS